MRKATRPHAIRKTSGPETECHLEWPNSRNVQGILDVFGVVLKVFLKLQDDTYILGHDEVGIRL